MGCAVTRKGPIARPAIGAKKKANRISKTGNLQHTSYVEQPITAKWPRKSWHKFLFPSNRPTRNLIITQDRIKKAKTKRHATDEGVPAAAWRSPSWGTWRG